MLPRPGLCHSIYCPGGRVLITRRLIHLEYPSSPPPRCSICSWHCHHAVILPFPYTLSAPSHVTLPIPVAPGPSELSCWEPGWVVWDRKQQRPWSHLRNLKNSIPTRFCARLWRNEGKTDPWPQKVNGLFVWIFFFFSLFREGLT